MRLYVGPTSPFARLATVVAQELKVELSVERINVYEAEFLDELNPLRQIPTLELDDGKAIYDSRNICHYFDRLSDTDNLWHDEDYPMLTRMSLALGIMESGLSRFMESQKVVPLKCAETINKLEIKVLRAIISLEENPAFFDKRPLAMDHLSAACALEYTDFRYTRDWRKQAPRLTDWLEDISARESMASTRPVLT